MHAHDHAVDEAASLRPKSSRLEESAPAHLAHAAATGRSDVLDSGAVLGLQRMVGNSGVGAVLEEQRSPVHDVVGSGGGSPLAPDVRTEMEDRLGHDFSDVRVHNDSTAHESAKAVNAHAYTVGSDVVFQRDRFDPSSTEGKTTLAHELTHVVQQRSGPVAGTPTAGGISVSDPSDSFEREAVATAERAMSAPLGATQVASHAEAGHGAAVQRDAAPEETEEEPTVQGMFVQREAESEEDEEIPG